MQPFEEPFFRHLSEHGHFFYILADQRFDDLVQFCHIDIVIYIGKLFEPGIDAGDHSHTHDLISLALHRLQKFHRQRPDARKQSDSLHIFLPQKKIGKAALSVFSIYMVILT